ncbi:MAG: hypothetical protein NTW59_02610 [Candidatus Diapherotrites archaeon]|nr:hypothetical protein [Candidatus Diapherotrites archaeon]
MGRVRFVDGSSKRVAVKRFHAHTPLSDANAAEYGKAIKDLLAAGVPLPKMEIVKHHGEWVLVSQAFLRKGKSKMTGGGPMTKKGCIQLARVWARVINAGYHPTGDFIGVIKHGILRREEIIPIDLDVVVGWRNRPISEKIATVVYGVYSTRRVYKKVFQAFVEELKPEYRQMAREIIAKEARIKL